MVQSLDLCHFSMHGLTFLNHLLNFLAPAIFLAVLLALGARLIWRGSSPLVNLWEQMLLNAVLGAVVLGVCLVLWGRDGKLATYALLVLSMGSCQWLLQRGWRA